MGLNVVYVNIGYRALSFLFHFFHPTPRPIDLLFMFFLLFRRRGILGDPWASQSFACNPAVCFVLILSSLHMFITVLPLVCVSVIVSPQLIAFWGICSVF